MIKVNSLAEYFGSKTFQEFVDTHDIDLSDRMLAYLAVNVGDKGKTKSLLKEVRALTEDLNLITEIDEYLSGRYYDEDVDREDKFWNGFKGDLPYPFKRGDIVRWRSEPDDLGIIEDDRAVWEKYKDLDVPFYDESYTCAAVSFLNRNTGKVYYYHPDVLDLERVTLPNDDGCDSYQAAVRMLSLMMLGKTRLSTAMLYTDGYRQDIKLAKENKSFFKRNGRRIKKGFNRLRETIGQWIMP